MITLFCERVWITPLLAQCCRVFTQLDMSLQLHDLDASRTLMPDMTSSRSPPKNPNTPHRLRQWWEWPAISQILSILWLAPVCALLWLNFTGYVAGAGVGCMGFCNLDLDQATRLRLDSQNSDILGALQLVAKVLEVWFAVVAGCLVYDLSTLLSTKRDGLPLRHLFTHLQFADPRYIFSASAWTALKPKARRVEKS
jgi:hypothetical protein